MLKDTVDFAKSVEEMMRQTLGVSLDEQVEEEPEIEEDATDDNEEQEINDDEEEDAGEVEEMHDEL